MRLDLGPGVEAARTAALAEVDRIASARVAALGGETAAHRLKRAEAARALSEGGSIGLLYPVLAAECAATGQSIQELARVVTERAEAWTLAIAKIEARRIAARAALRAASTAPELRRILRDFQEGETA